VKVAFRILISLILVCCLASCASRQADLSKHALPTETKPSIIFINKVVYDAHGVPLFKPVLNKRPEKANEQFTVVYFVDGRVVKSFDIIISEQKLDLARPRNILYQWTGKGFEVGAVLGYATMRAASSSNSKEGWIVLAVGAALPIVGGVTGFVIGTWAIMPEAMEDIKKLLTSTETLISFMEYEYDAQGRLILMKMLQPDEKPRELVRTEFLYTKDERIPLQTKIISYPENKIRTIP
jgi:YD repeat-containing protein